jgi:PhoH-like ATPase
LKGNHVEKPTILDTNILLDYPDIISDYDNILMPVTVLNELDNHKNSPTLGYGARRAIRSIMKYTKSGKIFDFDTFTDNRLSGDENILASADRNRAMLVTQDLAMFLLAKAKGITCKFFSDSDNEEYTPFVHDSKPTLKLEESAIFDEELETFQQYIKEKFGKPLMPWQFYTTKNQIYCMNPKTNMLESIHDVKEYDKIKIDIGVDYKPKDIYQRMALYSIVNADATLLTGSWGSGKSLTALSMALHLVGEGKKVFIMRPTLEAKRYAIGFTPGGVEEKSEQFLSGFLSAFYTLYGNTKIYGGDASKDGQRVNFDYVKEEIMPAKVEILTVNTLHGLSLQQGDILIVDEVQLFDVSYMSLLLSRVGDGAKVIMLGDLNQTINLLHRAESGLQKLTDNLPHAGVCHVELRGSYRNKNLSDLATKLMK